MSFVHPAFFAVLTFVAVATCCILGKFRSRPLAVGKYQAIDGLRGYLALFVFFHHAAISYFYITTGRWAVPPSNLSVHFGQSSVSLFFMITAFLFYGKVIDSRSGRIDWLKFFVGRVFRLVPLYAVAVVLLLCITFVESHGVLHDTWRHLIKCVANWFLFTIFDEPFVNGLGMATFMAGVNWSLPYEWYFYFSLPLLALTQRVKVQWGYLLASVAIVYWAVQHGALAHHAMVFAGGIAAAWLVRWSAFTRLAKSQLGSTGVAACVAILVAFFDTAFGIPQLFLLVVAFALIAGGADFFGAFSAKTSHVLGEISYSVYLLHGMLLFVVLKYVVGYEAVRAMSPAVYWMTIGVLVAPLLLLSTAAYRFVESPAMRLTSGVAARLRSRPSASFSDPLFESVKRDTGGPAF